MTLTPIRIAAAVISDRLGRVLLVRKRNTRFFMQPGGKVDAAETPVMALVRELREELGCTVVAAAPWGVFSAPAANEPGRDVEAVLFGVEIAGEVAAANEIQEIIWAEPRHSEDLPLAPLTRDHVLPLVRSRMGQTGNNR